MIRSITYALASILFFSIPFHAQYYIKILGYSADTIYPKLKNASSIEKMHLYNQLAFYHSFSTADSALYYGEMALELADKYDNFSEKASAFRNKGNAHALAGNYRQAVINLQQALNILINHGETGKMAELYVDLGKLNYDLEDYDKALIYADKLIRLADQTSEKGIYIATPFEKAIITGMGAGAAREAREYTLAVKYFKEYIEISKSLNIPASFHTAWVTSLAEIYNESGNLDSALKYTYMARSFLTENKNKPFQEHTGYEGAIGEY